MDPPCLEALKIVRSTLVGTLLNFKRTRVGGGGGGVERKEEVGKELSVDTGEVVSLGSKIKGIYRF